jgi:uncharacterized protein YecE (DUF72 family)
MSIQCPAVAVSKRRWRGYVARVIRVGCSGWLYRDWRGLVYPQQLAQRQWFEHYTSLFDTVELNTTFYRLPKPESVQKWHDAAPPGFVYALKLGQFGSHRMKLNDAASWLPNHVDRATTLGQFLGPTLVQLPPKWRRNVTRLEEFFAATHTADAESMTWALEIREPSWLHDDVYEVLRRNNAALCVHDMIADHPFELTTDWTYVRFHGPDALRYKYWGLYGPERLEPWAQRLAELAARGVSAYCYFNNDYQGFAVADAQWLRERVAELTGASVSFDHRDGG